MQKQSDVQHIASCSDECVRISSSYHTDFNTIATEQSYEVENDCDLVPINDNRQKNNHHKKLEQQNQEKQTLDRNVDDERHLRSKKDEKKTRTSDSPKAEDTTDLAARKRTSLRSKGSKSPRVLEKGCKSTNISPDSEPVINWTRNDLENCGSQDLGHQRRSEHEKHGTSSSQQKKLSKKGNCNINQSVRDVSRAHEYSKNRMEKAVIEHESSSSNSNASKTHLRQSKAYSTTGKIGDFHDQKYNKSGDDNAAVLHLSLGMVPLNPEVGDETKDLTTDQLHKKLLENPKQIARSSFHRHSSASITNTAAAAAAAVCVDACQNQNKGRRKSGNRRMSMDSCRNNLHRHGIQQRRSSNNDTQSSHQQQQPSIASLDIQWQRVHQHGSENADISATNEQMQGHRQHQHQLRRTSEHDGDVIGTSEGSNSPRRHSRRRQVSASAIATAATVAAVTQDMKSSMPKGSCELKVESVTKAPDSAFLSPDKTTKAKLFVSPSSDHRDTLEVSMKDTPSKSSEKSKQKLILYNSPERTVKKPTSLTSPRRISSPRKTSLPSNVPIQSPGFSTTKYVKDDKTRTSSMRSSSTTFIMDSFDDDGSMSDDDDDINNSSRSSNINKTDSSNSSNSNSNRIIREKQRKSWNQQELTHSSKSENNTDTTFISRLVSSGGGDGNNTNNGRSWGRIRNLNLASSNFAAFGKNNSSLGQGINATSTEKENHQHQPQNSHSLTTTIKNNVARVVTTTTGNSFRTLPFRSSNGHSSTTSFTDTGPSPSTSGSSNVNMVRASEANCGSIDWEIPTALSATQRAVSSSGLPQAKQSKRTRRASIGAVKANVFVKDVHQQQKTHFLSPRHKVSPKGKTAGTAQNQRQLNHAMKQLHINLELAVPELVMSTIPPPTSLEATVSTGPITNPEYSQNISYNRSNSNNMIITWSRNNNSYQLDNYGDDSRDTYGKTKIHSASAVDGSNSSSEKKWDSRDVRDSHRRKSLVYSLLAESSIVVSATATS